MTIGKTLDGENILTSLPEINPQDTLMYIQVLIARVEELEKKVYELEVIHPPRGKGQHGIRRIV